MEVWKPRPVAEERAKDGAPAQSTSLAIGGIAPSSTDLRKVHPVSWLRVPERD
jgi:hypothetical protein